MSKYNRSYKAYGRPYMKKKRSNSYSSVKRKVVAFRLLSNPTVWLIAGCAFLFLFFRKQIMQFITPIVDGSSNALGGIFDFLGTSNEKKGKYENSEKLAMTLSKTAFSHDYFYSLPDSITGPSSEFDGIEAARQIHGAIYLFGFIVTPWANDWSTIIANIKKCRTKVSVSYLCACYYSEYKDDLLQTLTHGFMGMKDEENYSFVMNYVNNLPDL